MSKISKKERAKNYSVFGKRLNELMKNAGITSVAELARQLYDNNLIKCKQKNSYTKDFENNIYGSEYYLKLNSNIINRIAKRITRLMYNDTDFNFEYLKALQSFFNCSSDYLLGFSDISSKNVELKIVGEKLGLSNEAITNLENSLKEPFFFSENNFDQSKLWTLNVMLKSEYWFDLVRDIDHCMYNISYLKNETDKKIEEQKKIMMECGISSQRAEDLIEEDMDVRTPNTYEPSDNEVKAVYAYMEIDKIKECYLDDYRTARDLGQFNITKTFYKYLDNIICDKVCLNKSIVTNNDQSPSYIYRGRVLNNT